MSNRPDFLAEMPHKHACSFRDKCLKLMEQGAIARTKSGQYWSVEIGDFEISWINKSLFVYHVGDLIWADNAHGWYIEDHEAYEYEDMLDRLIVLDALADV